MAGSFDQLYLDITSEPPSEFYNQQGGKYNCFVVRVRLRGNLGPAHAQSNLMLPLSIRLLYENQKVVANQQVLQLMNHPELSLKNRTGTIKARINDVSKNHQSQLFRLSIDLAADSISPPLPPVQTALTSALRVLSKKRGSRSKAKVSPKVQRTAPGMLAGSRGAPAFHAPAVAAAVANPLVSKHIVTSKPVSRKRKIADVGVERLLPTEWCNSATQLLRELEWMEVGYEYRETGPGQMHLDKSRPIKRCPACRATQYVDHPGRHSEDCRLQMLVKNHSDIAFDGSAPASLPRPAKLARNGSGALTTTHGPFGGPHGTASLAAFTTSVTRSSSITYPSLSSFPADFNPADLSLGSMGLLSLGTRQTSDGTGLPPMDATSMVQPAELAIAGISTLAFAGTFLPAVDKAGKLSGFYDVSDPSKGLTFKQLGEVGDAASRAELQASLAQQFNSLRNASPDQPRSLCMVGPTFPTLQMLKATVAHTSRQSAAAGRS